MNRLQALPFSDAYLPSDSIQTAKINWEYKNLEDTVIVEVWDVVDVGKAKRKISSGLLTSHEGVYDEEETKAEEELVKNLASFDLEKISKEGHHKLSILDASLIDVYKGANAVILIFDITKKWTFQYIQEEIKNIPENLDFIVLANCFDLTDKRVVTDEEIEKFKKSSKRKIRVIPTSMKNCYGLKQLHTYLQLPFSKLKVKQNTNLILD
jgi:GTPase SAR1 family protein